MYAGTEEQKDRWLWPLLSGEDFWCQLFSEPGAGSDLAALSTRAERDGDHWVVNGQKVWTSYAHIAKWGILLARTDPMATKHMGISYFVCPMDAPGIDIRPLIDMTGEHAFNEVFLTDVRIPADHLIGPEHAGWELAKVTLGNERVSLSGRGGAVGDGPDGRGSRGSDPGPGRGRRRPGRRRGADASTRDRLVDVWIEAQILRVLRLRMVSAVLAGRAPGAEASVRKAIADAHGQHIMDLARDLAGPHAMLTGTGPAGTPGRPHLVPRLPLLAGADRRRRHGRGATQHRGRKGSRSAARSLTLHRSPHGTGVPRPAPGDRTCERRPVANGGRSTARAARRGRSPGGCPGRPGR